MKATSDARLHCAREHPQNFSVARSQLCEFGRGEVCGLQPSTHLRWHPIQMHKQDASSRLLGQGLQAFVCNQRAARRCLLIAARLLPRRCSRAKALLLSRWGQTFTSPARAPIRRGRRPRYTGRRPGRSRSALCCVPTVHPGRVPRRRRSNGAQLPLHCRVRPRALTGGGGCVVVELVCAGCPMTAAARWANLWDTAWWAIPPTNPGVA